MKAFLFSKGESTTDLSKWSLERLGFDVRLIYDPKTTLFQKYLQFLNDAKNESEVVRCDADVIVNKNFTKFVQGFMEQKNYWWMHGMLYCYLRRELIYSTPSIMNNNAIKVGLAHFHEYKKESRPETAFSRAKEFMEPRRFAAIDFFTGIHGFKQYDEDIARVMQQKAERDQLKNWDMELIERMDNLKISRNG